MVKALSPSEVLGQKVSSIPDEIIEAMNQLLVEELSLQGTATILQKDLVGRARRLMAESGSVHANVDFYAKNWLDIEPVFRAAGWKVEYDKPAYCENYEAHFTFSKRKG